MKRPRIKFIKNRRGTAHRAVINKIYSQKRSDPSVFKKLANSFVWSMKGLQFAFVNERSLQIEAGMGIAAVILAAIAGATPLRWMAIAFSAGMLVICEMINSAVEMVCDHMVKKRYDKTIEIVKDIMSGTVLLCIINLSAVSLFFIVIPLVQKLIAFIVR
ncbi:MAG: diacylglycerol kinase [Spirochaetes bacterium]|nr:diacylglycerol kinase [Spirochaetota bacterium]